MNASDENTFRRGLTDGVPIGLGYLSVSFSFGILASGLGVPALWAVLISMTNLTSAGQVAGVGVIAAAGGYAEIALTQLVINLRYALMSLSLSQKLDETMTLPRRLLVSFGVTDEIFAVAAAKERDVGFRYMLGLICIPYVGWTVGTTLGVLAGSLLPDFLKSALGIALYGMFAAIVVPPAKKNVKLLPVVGAAAALSCLIRYLPALSFISDGFSIILCTVIAASLGALLFPVSDREEGGQ